MIKISKYLQEAFGMKKFGNTQNTNVSWPTKYNASTEQNV